MAAKKASTASAARSGQPRYTVVLATPARAADLLADALRDALAHAPRDGRAEALAAAAGAYARFVLRGVDDPALRAAGRAVMDLLLPPALAVAGDAPAALALLERQIAAAHGYAVLHTSGFLGRRTVEEIAAGAAAVSRARATAVRA